MFIVLVGIIGCATSDKKIEKPQSQALTSKCVLGDCVNGVGTDVWSDGSKYSGESKDGVPNGKGVYTWQNGQKYEGKFKEGKINGQGTITYPDGSRYTGEWKSGQQNGKGELFDTEGNLVHKGLWKVGEFIEPPQYYSFELHGSDKGVKVDVMFNLVKWEKQHSGKTVLHVPIFIYNGSNMDLELGFADRIVLNLNGKTYEGHGNSFEDNNSIVLKGTHVKVIAEIDLKDENEILKYKMFFVFMNASINALNTKKQLGELKDNEVNTTFTAIKKTIRSGQYRFGFVRVSQVDNLVMKLEPELKYYEQDKK